MRIQAAENNRKTKELAWLLSLAGFIPFCALSIGLVFIGSTHPFSAVATEIFKIWSVVILSFLGGIRWGLAIANEPFDIRSLALSVVPTIVGWFSILLPDLASVLCLLLLFCAHGLWDSFAVSTGKAPPWFGSIRVWLTVMVAAAHILVILSIG